MKKAAIALSALIYASSGWANEEKCALPGHIWTADQFKEAGYTVHALSQTEKKRVITYVRKTEGSPPAELDRVLKFPGYAVFQTAAMLYDRGVPVSAPNRGAIYFTDKPGVCRIFSIDGISGELAQRIIHGTYQLHAN